MVPLDRLVDGGRRRHVGSVGGEVRESRGSENVEDCMMETAVMVCQKVGMRNDLRAYGPANTRPEDEVGAGGLEVEREQKRSWEGGFKYV